MTAALTNHSHAEAGTKRWRSSGLTPYPVFAGVLTSTRPPLPRPLHSLLVPPPPLASFPSLLSQAPMVQHFSLSLVSTFNFLSPLPSAIYPLPVSNSRFLQQPIFSAPTLRPPSTAGESRPTLKIGGAAADLCFPIAAEFSTPFLNLS